ncbi:helix-turn-helix transcriptional regulator [Haloferax namakaokahaiae]|uniref:Helix-turn-helix transcriptional regulator n=1 Tax=Haloferax namakaokahaiae TaxID=1748331 RepID=A0ABD5ZI78_9EURY
MRSAVPLVALLTLLAGVLTPVAAAEPVAFDAQDPARAALGDSALVAQQSAVDQTPKTDIVIELRSDRSARWRIEMRYPLETANETAAFEQFAQEYESGQADTGFDRDLFENIAASASEQTGRSMAIENVSQEGIVQNDTGILRLSFTWTNFLEETDSGVRLGDVFESESGEPWLTSLQANQNLTIHTPPGFALNSNSNSLPFENNSIVIEGPRTFESTEDLEVSYRSTGGDGGGVDAQWILAGAGVLVLFAVAAVLYVRRRPTSDDASSAAAASEPVDEPVERHDEPVEGPIQEPDHDEVEPEEEPGIDLDLLSDEERVEHMLEQNGGRMKQATIVKETGWSDAKVSQLLSSMADEERVEKLRLGRENLISLPDENEIPE